MENQEAVVKIAKSNVAFCHALHKVLKNDDQRNMIYSPLSAQLVLFMVYLGAEEKTAEEMEHALKISKNRAFILSIIKYILEYLKSTPELTIDVANKIFVQEGFPIKDDFQRTLKEVFQSEAQLLNFRDCPSEASKAMNSWVREKTRDKIKELIQENELGSDSKMILINCIYFKSKWLSEFSVAGQKPFHVTRTKMCEATMITNTATYNYAQIEELKSQVLELQYQGEQVSMLVLLPNEVEGLASLEEKFSDMLISDICDQLKYTEVFITMPKFKLEETIDLNDCLMKMGMETMFSNNANFTGISDEALKVSKVLQKAFISVDEYGTEAAAATYLHMVGCCAPMVRKPPEVFKADHPFMFALINKKYGLVLFLGVFAKP